MSNKKCFRRIGPAPALSLVPPSTSATPVMSIEPTSPRLQSPVLSTMPSASQIRSPTSQFSSLPTSGQQRPGTAGSAQTPDEFGYGAGYGKPAGAGAGARHTIDTKLKDEEASIATRPSVTGSIATTQQSLPTARRPNSARATNPANRFTITNAEPEIPEESSIGHVSGSPGRPVGNTTPSQQQQQQQTKPWMTAEEEKRAYETARSRVEKVQGVTVAVSFFTFLTFSLSLSLLWGVFVAI